MWVEFEHKEIRKPSYKKNKAGECKVESLCGVPETIIALLIDCTSI